MPGCASWWSGGTEPACDPPDWVDDPDQASPHPTASRFTAQITRAARRLPALTIPNTPAGTAGIYDVADDWTPIYDKTSLPGYYVAMGTSGNQFKNAPMAGVLMAALIESCSKGHDHDADSVTVVCQYTGHTVNLGHYSRVRQVNKDSSFSVFG